MSPAFFRCDARRLVVGVGVCVAVALSLLVCAGSVFAADSPVWWGVQSASWPSSLPVEGNGRLVVTVQNRGFGTVDAVEDPVVVRDVLPAGLKVVGVVEGVAGEKETLAREQGPLECRKVSVREVECVFSGVYQNKGLQHHPGEDRRLGPYETLEVRVPVQVQPGAVSGEESTVTVTGGGAASMSMPWKISVGRETPFGIESHDLLAEEHEGAPATQAGVHPFQITDVLSVNTSAMAKTVGQQEPAGLAKKLTFKLPAGLIGDPTVIPDCTESQFTTEFIEPDNPVSANTGHNSCPARTAVGVVSVTLNNYPGPVVGLTTRRVPLFNLPPLPGEPARFGFEIDHTRTYLNTSVRTGSDYGVTVEVKNITELIGFLGSRTTFWGVPGAAVHDSARGWGCLDGEGPCAAAEAEDPPPFLSMPTACTGAMPTTVQASSWQEPLPAEPFSQALFVQSEMTAMNGCNHLQFGPGISVAPDVPDAATATGLEVKIHVPQTAALTSEGLAEGTVRDTTVALPAGVTLNPGGAGGLSSCTADPAAAPGSPQNEIGYLGGFGANEEMLFSEKLPQPVSPGENFCPKEAKIGTVAIQTPLLPNPLEGAVYLATPAPQGAVEPGRNPFNALIGMYIVAKDPVSGTLVKLPGQTQACERTGETIEGFACETPGQIVSTFKNTPELPFENLILHFFGGGRAPLATPNVCGTYTTQAVFTPWSAEPGSEPVKSTSAFDVTSGPNGTPCPPDPRAFTPELNAETVNNQAGSYSELRTTMGHPDADQPLSGLNLTMPPGVMGSLAHVTLCGEPQAAQGTCGPESLIGHTTVTAGLGSTPAVVARPGDVYITGPYNGHGACTVGEPGCAPFGLSIANPAETGPFDLEKGTPCDCVVVRAKIEVDPLTAQLKITTGALPTMLRGIPLDLQHIMVGIDRPNFTFNPTSCEHESFTGTMSGGEGTNTPVSVPFQAANCATLKFTPNFKVSTNGKTSRLDGASLNVKVTYPKGSLGTQANLHYVKVDLPKQLPSNLEALKHACPAATFEANPAACDPISKVGSVVVHTQVLPVPLEGPAIFVSYGGAKFPELVFVLQGYGVTVDVHAETFIDSKTSVTSSTIRNAPDVPFETFELNLPERPKYAALAAPYGLCNITKTKIVKKKVAKRVHGKIVRKNGRVIKITKKIKKQVATGLVMPTHFIGQNGAEIKQNTLIEVVGCPRSVKKNKRAKSKRHGNKKGKSAARKLTTNAKAG
jgi:hypothetical protein